MVVGMFKLELRALFIFMFRFALFRFELFIFELFRFELFIFALFKLLIVLFELFKLFKFELILPPLIFPPLIFPPFIFPPGFINCCNKFIEEFKLLFKGLDGMSLPELFLEGDFGFMSELVKLALVSFSSVRFWLFGLF